MNQSTNTRLTIEAWADITIKEWIKKAGAQGVSADNPLNAGSFVHHVITNADGDPEKIQFMYDYWLNFVDWGLAKEFLWNTGICW